jgi:copper chaperone CopZ
MSTKSNYKKLNWFIFLSFFSAYASSIFAESIPPQQKITITVTGMVCGGCAATIEETLKNMSGITSVTATPRAQTVEILHDPTARFDEIVNAIRKLGYGAQL